MGTFNDNCAPVCWGRFRLQRQLMNFHLAALWHSSHPKSVKIYKVYRISFKVPQGKDRDKVVVDQCGAGGVILQIGLFM